MIQPLSSWASGRAHKALGHTTDPATRLAIALGSVRSVVRVIDRSMPPMAVDWARVDDDKSMSFTDFRGHRIAINPKPILDGRIDHGFALDVCIGFGCHEASHSQESRDRFEHLLKKVPVPAGGIREGPAFEPMRVAAYLWNVVEDVRIEQATAKEWPGFEPYFDSVLGYMWEEMLFKHELPTQYGPDLAGMLRVAFLACRYPEPAKRLDPSLQFEIGWWQSWQHDYLTDRTDTPTTIRLGLEHLVSESPEAGAEMLQMAAEEQEARARGEKIRAQLERLIRDGIDGTYDICINEEGEVTPLDAETAEAVDQLVREGLIEHKTVVRAVGARNPTIHVRKPEETQWSKRSYIGKPGSTVQALRTALVFRNSAPQHDLKLLKSGTIDDEELYRWGMDDYRVFSERVIESKPDVFMALLVDISGSMYGRKMQIAQQLAQLFVWALHDQEGVETAVWAHTGDVMAHDAEVYRVWEKGDPMTRLGLLETLPHSDNYDGVALSVVVNAVAKVEQPQKIVVVLSDGLPSGAGYGGAPAAAHVRRTVKWAERQGVTVWQIAIDPHDIRPEEQESMYPGSWIGYESDARLPKQLTALMSRFL